MVNTHDWLEIRKIIFSEIQNFYLQNLEILDQYRENNEQSEFYEILQKITLKHLNNNTNLLNYLTELQISYIPKYIIAIYLILINSDSNMFNMEEIQSITVLYNNQTDKIM